VGRSAARPVPGRSEGRRGDRQAGGDGAPAPLGHLPGGPAGDGPGADDAVRLHPHPAGGQRRQIGRRGPRPRGPVGGAVAAPGRRVGPEPGPGRAAAAGGGRVLLVRGAALHGDAAGAGPALPLPAGGVPPAADGAGAGHGGRADRLRHLPDRTTSAGRRLHRHAGRDVLGGLVGCGGLGGARRRRRGEPVRRDALDARRVGAVVRPGVLAAGPYAPTAGAGCRLRADDGAGRGVHRQPLGARRGRRGPADDGGLGGGAAPDPAPHPGRRPGRAGRRPGAAERDGRAGGGPGGAGAAGGGPPALAAGDSGAADVSSAGTPAGPR
jgi:translation initiation factor IF-2